MGEKLELRLKSPVGAEPAVYPWPLPVYVSAPAGTGGGGRGAPGASVWSGLRPFLARARGCRCLDAACRAVAASAAAPGSRVSGLCGPESGEAVGRGIIRPGRPGTPRAVNLMFSHTVVCASSSCLSCRSLMSS